VFMQEVENSNAKLVSIKQGQDLLNARFDHFSQALAPATQHALFDDAIYEFASKAISPNWTWPPRNNQVRGECSALTSFVQPPEASAASA
jgi:hypothetical protein